MNEYERGWIEAAIDGEGMLTVSRWKRSDGHGISNRPMLQISNTNILFLQKARQIIGGGTIYRKSDVRRAVHKQSWILQVDANTLRCFLPEISLLVKESQRKLVLLGLAYTKDAVTSRRNRNQLDAIVKEIRTLNHKGPSELASYRAYSGEINVKPLLSRYCPPYE